MSDYISREAAIRAILTIKDYGNSDRANALGLAELAITTLPAADVAEVRRGRWIKSPECPEEYDICSVCGKTDKHRSRGNWEHDVVESVPPFCKWCGAKLDGGQEDG